MKTQSLRRPPGSAGYPLIGDAPDYLRDPLDYLVRTRARYGGLARLAIPFYAPYLVSDPALIEHVLVTDNKSYSKDAFLKRLGQEVVGQGLLTSEGDFWRRQRRLAQPAFHRERIAQYAAIMTSAGEKYVDGLRSGQLRDLHADMMHLTLQIVSKTLLSTDVGDLAGEVGEILGVIMDRYANGIFLLFPALARLPLPMNRRFEQAVKRLDQVILPMIRERRQSGVEKDDLLSMLLSAQDEDGSAMTDAQLRDEVITIFAAGHETTALVLTYVFFLLSQNPPAAAQLAAELDAALAGRAPTMQDLPALRYTEAVVLESMRCYPPAWAIGREAVRDTELGGYPIPRGTQLWISPWVLHHDPQTFPEPERFLPERWLDGLQRRLPRYAYAPFGGGPRLCIGNAFAMTEAILLVATIARRFFLRVVDKPPLRLLPSVTLRVRSELRARVEPVGDSR